jgi:methionyl-tRNA formyltransferase
MKRFVLLTSKPWHDDLFYGLSLRSAEHWFRISDEKDFTAEKLQVLCPDRIFIPHWSSIIKEDIWSKHVCVVFHMTDLPFGRGGSPLQNLIQRGISKTRISSIRINGGLDTGDIYNKRDLSLEGTALEIFTRAAPLIGTMIEDIIDLEAKPQTGEVVLFKRRTREDGELSSLSAVSDVYDYIRMLDCEGYPKAYIEASGGVVFEFHSAAFQNENILEARVVIRKR